MDAPANMPPLIRTDGTNKFAYDTMRLRHPEMIERVIKTNPDFPNPIRDELEAIRLDLMNGSPILMLNLYPSPTPDYVDWASAYLERREGDRPTWLNTDWFFAETVLFRVMIEAVRWWETRHDPFGAIKQEELDSPGMWEMLDIALNLGGGAYERMPTLAKMATWGNRIDLSYMDSAALGSMTAKDDDLLIDHSEAMTAHLLRAQLESFPRQEQGVSHVIVDNTGTELAMDLALVDALLTGFSDVVIVHVKYHPTFVSDATAEDVHHMINMCLAGQHGGKTYPSVIALGERLQDAFRSGRLRLAPNLFWNGCRFLWEMPRALSRVFEEAQLVILKGDANYRRAVGDAIWPSTASFDEVMSYFPAPLVALRTLKSDPIVGLSPGKAEQLDGEDHLWRVNGKRGLVQLKL